MLSVQPGVQRLETYGTPQPLSCPYVPLDVGPSLEGKVG